MQSTSSDSRNQELFIGLDVHQKHWNACLLTASAEHKTFHQRPSVRALVGYVGRHFPHARVQCAYEAGYSGWWIQEQLTASGIPTIVVHPADIPTSDKERKWKNDRVDCRKLARMLRQGDLTAIDVPPVWAQEDRRLVRLRQTLVRDQTRTKNRIKALLSSAGIELPADITTRYWSRRFAAWLDQVHLHTDTGTSTLRLLVDQLSTTRQLLAEVTRQVRHVAATDRYRSLVSSLCGIRGIGVLSAMVLTTELVDIRRFQTLDKLASYVGLVPTEHSSGGIDSRGHMTHRANNAVKTTVIEAAWIAARHDPVLAHTYEAAKRRMPANRAIILIARKLLNRIRHAWLHSQSPGSGPVPVYPVPLHDQETMGAAAVAGPLNGGRDAAALALRKQRPEGRGNTESNFIGIDGPANHLFANGEPVQP